MLRLREREGSGAGPMLGGGCSRRSCAALSCAAGTGGYRDAGVEGAGRAPRARERLCSVERGESSALGLRRCAQRAAPRPWPADGAAGLGAALRCSPAFVREVGFARLYKPGCEVVQ